MQWSDSAIVLSARPHGERALILRVLAKDHGVSAGIVPAGRSKTQRGVFEPGNVLLVNWNARLAEQLGRFTAELIEATPALIMHDEMRLTALSSLCVLLERGLPEHVAEPALWDASLDFIARLKNDKPWQLAYARLEYLMLAECGFQLDLSACAATGTREDLCYVSPKSGRAVSREAGAPYHDRMLPLPGFFQNSDSSENGINPKETLDALTTTGYFLAHWLLEPHGRKLPPARARLVQLMQEQEINTHGVQDYA